MVVPEMPYCVIDHNSSCMLTFYYSYVQPGNREPHQWFNNRPIWPAWDYSWCGPNPMEKLSEFRKPPIQDSPIFNNSEMYHTAGYVRQCHAWYLARPYLRIELHDYFKDMTVTETAKKVCEILKSEEELELCDMILAKQRELLIKYGIDEEAWKSKPWVKCDRILTKEEKFVKAMLGMLPFNCD